MIQREQITSKVRSLPTLSTAISQLSSMLHNEKASASDFEKIIKPDLALTANLLKLTNSAFFGLTREVASVKQAVALLGTTRVFELATSLSMANVVPPVLVGYQITAEVFWQHSIAVAVLADALRKEARLDVPELVFTAGLLHDIGKLIIGVFLATLPEAEILQMRGEGIAFVEIERKVLGIDHAEVGMEVASKWNLPAVVCLATRYHHTPDEVEDPRQRNLISMIYAADKLAYSLDYPASDLLADTEIPPELTARLGVPLDRLQQIAVQSIDTILNLSHQIMTAR